MAGTWTWFNSAKKKLGEAAFNFTGAGDYLLTLHVSSGATVLSNGHDFSTLASLSTVTGQLASANGYVKGGKTLSSNAWFASGEGYGFCANGVCWSANGGGFAALKYAVIHLSTAAKSGTLVCFATLSSDGTLISVADGSAIKINGGAASNAKIFSLA